MNTMVSAILYFSRLLIHRMFFPASYPSSLIRPNPSIAAANPQVLAAARRERQSLATEADADADAELRCVAESPLALKPRSNQLVTTHWIFAKSGRVDYQATSFLFPKTKCTTHRFSIALLLHLLILFDYICALSSPALIATS